MGTSVGSPNNKSSMGTIVGTERKRCQCPPPRNGKRAAPRSYENHNQASASKRTVSKDGKREATVFGRMRTRVVATRDGGEHCGTRFAVNRQCVQHWTTRAVGGLPVELGTDGVPYHKLG